MLLKQITVVKVQKQKHIIHISKCLEIIINNSKYFKLKYKMSKSIIMSRICIEDGVCLL